MEHDRRKVHNQPSQNFSGTINYPRNSSLSQDALSAVPLARNMGSMPMSYPTYTLPYQNTPHDMSGLGNMDSPVGRTGSMSGVPLGSSSDYSGRRNSGESPGHAPSMTSGRILVEQGGNGSLDGEFGPSPQSARDQIPQDTFEDFGDDENMGHSSMQDGGIDSTPDAGSKKSDDKDKPPAWSELKTKAGKERKRLPLACIACRRKKIRCSGEKPACKHCLRSRIPCVYKVTTRKAAPRTDYMAMLDKRLKRMEERVIKCIPKDELRDIPASERANVRPPPPGLQPKTPTGKKRPADEAFKSELDQWAHAGVNKSTEAAIQSTRPPRSRDGEESLLTEGADALPSKEIQEHLSEVYFDYLYGQAYFLLHKPSFMRRLHSGNIPPVLILAICAISARFSNHPQVTGEPAFLRGENWASVARDIIMRRYDEPNMTILTVQIILGLHEFGTCQGGRSWTLGGMAMRTAYALQLHREMDHDPLGKRSDKNSKLSFTDREIRRRTMWSCFLMDRFNSSGTERPTFMSQETIQVQLPIREDYFQLETPGPTETLEGEISDMISPDTGQQMSPKDNMGLAAYMIRIVYLWGRVNQYLNLGGREKDPHPCWHPQSKWPGLKQQVDDFRASLPHRLLYNKDNLHVYASQRIANQFLFLHIAYWQVVLSIHRWAIPSSPGGHPPRGIPKQFLSDAGHAAIEAASQVSSLIADSAPYPMVAPFAGYCAFASGTVHIWGMFSKNSSLEAASKRNLATNVKYLSKMKKYWGMFHFMAESLKDIYRQYADAALKGVQNHTSKEAHGGHIFQYGDWFNRYPHGVSKTDYEEPPVAIKKEAGNDAVLSQKSNLQSVEEFFRSISPPSKNDNQKKVTKRRMTKGNTASNSRSQNPQQSISFDQPASSNDHFTSQPQQPSLSNSMDLSSVPIHIDPSTQLSQSSQPFDSNYLSYLPPYAPSMVPHLDRQHVLGAYGTFDTSALDPTGVGTTPDSAQHNLAGTSNLWNMDLSTTGAGNFSTNFGSDSTSAWLMPFNMEPPEIGEDMSGIFGDGLTGFGLMGPDLGGLGDASGLGDVGTMGMGDLSTGMAPGAFDLHAHHQGPSPRSGDGSIVSGQ